MSCTSKHKIICSNAQTDHCLPENDPMHLKIVESGISEKKFNIHSKFESI